MPPFWKCSDSPETVTDIKDPERLRRTTAVIVALGKDDMDIEVAMRLRMLFDRLRTDDVSPTQTHSQERVKILSLVYNSKTVNNLSDTLRNHRYQPYNITFIGDRNHRYNYEMITARKDEQEALYHHARWLYTMRANGKKVDDYDPIRSLIDYSRYEYFRVSSMARNLHTELFNNDTFPQSFRNTDDKQGENYVIAHRRWSAFMRAGGYISGRQNDRAKRHKELVPYDALPTEKQGNDF